MQINCNFTKDLSETTQKLRSLSCKMSLKPKRRRRMNAFERRSEIVERMKIRKYDTACSLASEFGVSKCTIFRDIQELSCGGYPLHAEQGYGGGIRWTGGKRSFPFTEREVAALHNAIAAASPEDKPVLESLLRDCVKTRVERSDIFGILSGGQSQRELAAGLGISESHLSRLLSWQKKPIEALARKIVALRRSKE